MGNTHGAIDDARRQQGLVYAARTITRLTDALQEIVDAYERFGGASLEGAVARARAVLKDVQES